MTEFSDEPTPLPAPSKLERDPHFPTGYVPKIRLDDDELLPGALYPSWRFVSPCRTVDELARLYAPHFDGTSMYLFTHDVKEAGQRVEVILILATGKRVLAGVATVTESVFGGQGDFGRPGMRFAFQSVDSSSNELLAELGDIAEPIRNLVRHAPFEPSPRETIKMNGIPSYPDATTKMTKLEIADIVGIEPADAHAEWNDLLMCKLEIATSGECPPPPELTEPHQTGRSVISELAESRSMRPTSGDSSGAITAQRLPAAPRHRPTTGTAEVLGDSQLLDQASATWWRYRWWLVAATAAACVLVGIALIAT